jgi:hypothetical protein
MLAFAGFHVDRSNDLSGAISETRATIEARKRIVCQIFVADKLLATFVRRPPLLTRRFCSIKLPLDLADTTLLSDKLTYQRLVLDLDHDGWNMDDCLDSMRVRTMLALVGMKSSKSDSGLLGIMALMIFCKEDNLYSPDFPLSSPSSMSLRISAVNSRAKNWNYTRDYQPILYAVLPTTTSGT